MTPKYDLLPRDKYDDEAVAQLAQLPEDELRPLLPGLAEWIQDWNWPIALAVEKLLKLHVSALVPTILEVLAGNDEQWQWNILSLVGPDTLPTLPPPLRAALGQVTVFPTTGAYDMYVVWRARYVLRLYESHPLLPQSKTDDDAVERLHQLPEAKLLPLLPELMEWLEDLNWPVAGPVWNFLLPYVAHLEPAIVEVLMGYDDIWKCNLLRLIEYSALPALSPPLREMTERIAYQPTIGERENDTAKAARDLLNKYASHLLPQDKGDDYAVERLAKLPVEKLVPLAGKLLIWLQDMNWPIASAVAELLAPHVAAIEPHILEVLASEDNIWKDWLISCLLGIAPPAAITPTLRQVLFRLANSPTVGEAADGVDVTARNFLDDLAEAELS